MVNNFLAKLKSIRLNQNKRKLALLLSLVLLIGAAASGTLAYILDRTDEVTNSFIPAEVKCSVSGSGSAYEVTNDSNIPAYIRVVVIGNEMNGSNIVFGSHNVTVATGEEAGWTLSNGIYYYNSIVPAHQKAKMTLNGVTEGLTLQVLAEAIQAEGMGDDVTTAQQAWAAAKSRPTNP